MPSAKLLELIDTLWNVNYVFSNATLFGAGELIDTLWNVNTSAAEEPSGDAQELIDTLWNVNFKVVLYEVDGYTN